MGNILAAGTRLLEQKRKQAIARTEFLVDRDKQDKMVADFVRTLSPSKLKAKSSKYDLATEAVDAAIPKSHPMKGFAPSLLREFQEVIEDPVFRNVPPSELLYALGKQGYTDSAPDEPSLWHKSLQYKFREDVEFGKFGEDESIRAPVGYKEFREHMEVLTKQMVEEDRFSVSEWLKNIAIVGTAGTALGATVGGVTGGAPGALAGAFTVGTSGALAEAVVYPVRRGVMNIPGVRERIGRWKVSKAIDPSAYERILKPMAAMFATDVVPFTMAEKALARMFVLPHIVSQRAIAKPTAENLLGLGEVREGMNRVLLDKDIMDDVIKTMGSELVHGKKLGKSVHSMEELKEIFKSVIPIYGKRKYGGVADPRKILFDFESRAMMSGERSLLHQPYRPGVGKTITAEVSRKGKPLFEPGIGMAEEAPVYHHFKNLDSIGLDEAFGHPGGPLAGSRKASNRQAKRQMVTGEVSIEAAEESIARMQGRAKVLAAKIEGGAVKDLNEELRQLDVLTTRAVASAPTEGKADAIFKLGESMKASAREYHAKVAATKARLFNEPGIAKDTITTTTAQTTAESVVDQVPNAIPEPIIPSTVETVAEDAAISGQSTQHVNRVLASMQGVPRAEQALVSYQDMVRSLAGKVPERMSKRMHVLNQTIEEAVLSGSISPEDAYGQFRAAFYKQSSLSSLEAMGDRGARDLQEYTALPGAGREVRHPGEPHPVGAGVDVEPLAPPIEPAAVGIPDVDRAVITKEGDKILVRGTRTDALRKMSNKELTAELDKYRSVIDNPEGSTSAERADAARAIQERDRRTYVKALEAKMLKEPKYLVDTDEAPARILEDMENMTSDETFYIKDELELRLHQKYIPHRAYGVVEPGEYFESYVRRVYQERDEILPTLLTKEEYAAREAVLEAHDRALIRDGLATPSDKVPHMQSVEHLDEVLNRHETAKGGFYTSGHGFRGGIAAELEARASIQTKKTVAYQKKLAKYQQLDAEMELIGKPYTAPEAEAAVKSISARNAAGELSPDDTVKELVFLQDAVYNTTQMSSAEKAGFLDSLDPVLSQASKMASMIAFFSMLGVGPEIFSIFTGTETPFISSAEAGLTTSAFKSIGKQVGKGLSTARRGALMKAVVDSGYIKELITDPSKMVMYMDDFMKGLPDGKLGGPSMIRKDLNNFIKKGVRPGIRHALLSPYQKFEEALQIGKYIMNNPAVFRASYQAAEYHNIRNVNTILDNIFMESGIIENPTEIATMFDDLVPMMERQVSFEWNVDELGDAIKKLDGVKKQKTQTNKAAHDIDIKIAEDRVAYHQGELKGLEGAVEEYHTAWAQRAKEAAGKYPSARVYLSLWDGPTFEKAPFMRNIPLSPDEQVLVGRLREQLLVYKTRIDELAKLDPSIRTIKGPYAPVMLHPNFGADKFSEISGHMKAAVYMKMYRRTAGSRPLFPSIEYTMRRYASDTERRIQNLHFWKSGWDEVETMTRDFPVLAQAFQTLREGIRPIEMTWGNKVANMYVQFEAYKRLWFNPSAGGKHLIKQTSNWATTGFGESFYAYPESYKHLVKRSMDLTKRTRRAMSRGGVTGRKDQDKVINSFLHSVIPARNARQRLLDMGINTNDLYFSAGKEMWHRGQNAGAVWINMAEVFDRGVSAIAGINMAAKRGLTAEQSMYGVYDLILKNNFLSRELNPGWMRNPKIRAFIMFQGTPFKIAERRVIQAARSGRAINKGRKSLIQASKTPEGRAKLVKDFKDLRYLMKTTEREFKANLFIDALNSEVDFFGTPITQQFAKDIAIIGAASYGGAHWGMNLMHHFFHLPFFSGMTSDPVVSFSPGPMNAWRTWKTDVERSYADDEWLFGKFMQKWLGPTWIAPDIMWKAHRLNQGDIPELYQGSEFQYLFAIPADH